MTGRFESITSIDGHARGALDRPKTTQASLSVRCARRVQRFGDLTRLLRDPRVLWPSLQMARRESTEMKVWDAAKLTYGYQPYFLGHVIMVRRDGIS
jgi:hypothetical protein